MLNRREWLRGVGAAAALPLVSDWLTSELGTWGREVHVAAQSNRGNANGELMSRLSVVCERVIPTDESPGAVAAGVPRFIDHMLTAWYDPSERERVVMGLDALDEQAHARFSRAFRDATATEQDLLLVELDAWGAKSWFATIKYLTIWGYYTSEIGIKEELQQGPPPGRYDGCAPYAPRRAAGSQHAAE